jgi:hypothetical protein
MITKAYLIKMVFRGISPMIWRRFWVSGNTSLADFHHIIQIAYSWDNDYLHRFHIYGKDYGINYAGGIGFSDDAREVYIDRFGFGINDKFIYEYNFFKHWVIDIRIENIKDKAMLTPVCCLKGSGMPGARKHDETEATLNLLKAIVKKKATIGDIRDLVDELNAVRFNRHYVNHLLQKELKN